VLQIGLYKKVDYWMCFETIWQYAGMPK
jgi:hypothetical protein